VLRGGAVLGGLAKYVHALELWAFWRHICGGACCASDQHSMFQPVKFFSLSNVRNIHNSRDITGRKQALTCPNLNHHLDLWFASKV
jgi:hypothetical protein